MKKFEELKCPKQDLTPSLSQSAQWSLKMDLLLLTPLFN